MLQTYNDLHPETTFNIPILSFFIIGIGGLACILSGYLSQTFGAKRIAFTSLLLSCGCCLVFPFYLLSVSNAVSCLAFLGMVVVADSPLLSTLVAQNAPAEKGTTLTIVNSIDLQLQ
jgi:MFS family permease